MAPRSAQPPATGAPAKRTIEKTKPRKPRSTEGAAEARAAAKMTSEEWRKLQVGMSSKWPAPSYMSDPNESQRSHTNYRDETYEVVTRWRADTKICYRPHAKAPGSKSHVRYEHYAKARTVAEALKKGSFPADWCWDYERGFIKVLGPVRDEPLDLSKITDESEITEVDRIIFRWVKRELAKSLGLNMEDLVVGKGQQESIIMRAHRLAAQRAARKAVEEARKQNRKVTEQEVLTVLRAWRFARNASRQNVLPEDQEWVFSDTLGLLRDRMGDIHLTEPTRLYPEVTELFNLYLTDRLPAEVADFRWSSINVNCNYAARLHRDGNNLGPSFIKAFGDFKGGLLSYWPEDDKKIDKLEALKEKDTVQFDIKKNLSMFNGSAGHYVQPFEGERFSVVYFTVGCHSKAGEDCKERLRELGMQYPEPEEDPHRLLRAPRSYKVGGGRASAAPKAGPPAFRAYPAAALDKGRPPRRGLRLRAVAARAKATPERGVVKAAMKAPRRTPRGRR